MAKTRKFSSSPPPSASRKRASNERFVDETAKRVPMNHLAPNAPVTNIPSRSTLIMKPGQIASEAAAFGQAQPRKNYGQPADSLRTVMMSSQDEPQLKKLQARPESHPEAQYQKPPEIELVQHEMPTDAPPDSRLTLLADPDSEQAAAFRVLRHHVLEAGHPQVIAVSGPNDGCGKTTVAVNLAMALAECGRSKVLLVDANIRNPKIASILRYVPPWCFLEQLQQHKKEPFLPWGFVEISDQNLHVAAIDAQKETQRQRIDAPAFFSAITRLRLGPYEHIVIDCPSVIGNADVNLIQDATDGVLLAVRSKQVTARDIRTAVDQLTPTKIIGTALFE